MVGRKEDVLPSFSPHRPKPRAQNRALEEALPCEPTASLSERRNHAAAERAASGWVNSHTTKFRAPRLLTQPPTQRSGGLSGPARETGTTSDSHIFFFRPQLFCSVILDSQPHPFPGSRAQSTAFGAPAFSSPLSAHSSVGKADLDVSPFSVRRSCFSGRSSVSDLQGHFHNKGPPISFSSPVLSLLSCLRSLGRV